MVSEGDTCTPDGGLRVLNNTMVGPEIRIPTRGVQKCPFRNGRKSDPFFPFLFLQYILCFWSISRKVARVLNLKIIPGFTAFPAIRTQIGSNLVQPSENLKN